MNGLNRTLLTLLAAGATGALLWVASQFNTHGTGGYWAAMGVIAAGGLLLGLAQLRGGGGNPPAMFLVAFLPVAICSLWVIGAAEPHANTLRNHLRSWDSDLGITGAVHGISLWNGVLALGVGLVCGLTLEPGLLFRRRRVVTPAAAPVAVTATPDAQAADAPTTGELRERELATDGSKSETRTVRG